MTRIESLSVSIDILNDVLKSIAPDENYSDDRTTTSVGQLQDYDSRATTQDPPFANTKDYSLTDEKEPQIKLVVLLKLLVKLACLQIKNGENPNYSFASILPKLFYRTNTPRIPSLSFPLSFFPDLVTKKSVIPWRVDKSIFSCEVLKLCISCYVKRKIRSNVIFQICGVMIPNLVRNFDRTGLTEPLKFQLLQGEFFSVLLLPT